MSKSAAMDLVMQFMGKQNTIPTPVPFIRLLGDHAAAAFLAQCLYWGERTSDPGGEFHKTHEEWHEELVLSPDQVRRCVKTCGPLVTVRRKGVPARNFYRADRARVAAALEALAAGHPDPLSCWETQHQDVGKPDDKTPVNPTASHGQSPQQVVQETPQLVTEPTSEPTAEQKETPFAAGAAALAQGDVLKDQEQPQAEGGTHTPTESAGSANAGHGNATALGKVPGGAAGTVEKVVDNRRNAKPTDFARIVAAWNDHRGSLPKAQEVTEGRKKAVKKLLRDCDGDVDKAVQVVSDATREVAQDDFWLSHCYGFDNLVPGKVFGKAEAWRARQGQASAAPAANPTALKPSNFTPGQPVTYRALRYVVDQVLEDRVVLYDDENGETTVKMNSDYWNGLKPVGVSA